ncbi:hypothetical protein EXE59_15950 [Nocardioides eburneiflavus]|uniref:Uncharacterized protein n=1 Tax=Nocardioides eburneiflavus TaxID=2518372 RepID=A0A4Z1CG28_9ACTN|nr:hypothetical protein [Nocardioides eburneiflavus]TGN65285.1 hypothetical protein EXE59_15950 [Nocardioides eburneiflavus]
MGERLDVTSPLPLSIWVVAWASLAGQVLLVVRHGGRVDDEVSQVVSVVLGALLVGYVSAGVVRARRVRIVLAWVVLALAFIGGLVDLVSVDDVGQAAHALLALAAGAVSLVGLAQFCRSDWYAWQRTRPSAREGASIGQLVVIGVLVGALGGYVGLVDAGVTTRVNVNVG